MSDRASSTARAPQRTPSRTTPTRADLRLVQAAKKRSRSRQLVGALALVIMFSALLASAVFHSVLVAGQQRLDRLDQRVAKSQQELDRSQLQVAELSSPSRIVAAAKRSGMVVPDHTTWLAAKPPITAAPSHRHLARSGLRPRRALNGPLAGAVPAGGRTGSGRAR